MVVFLLVLMSRNMYVQCLAQLISVRGEGIAKGRGVIIMRFVRGVEIRVLCVIVTGVEIEGIGC